MIVTYKVTVALAGVDGSATGNATTIHNVSGRLVGVGIDVTTGSEPNTVDVTVATAGNNGLVKTLFLKSNVAASDTFYPQAATNLSSDGSAITGWYVDPPVDDFIKVSGAQGNAGSLIVYLMIESFN